MGYLTPSSVPAAKICRTLQIPDNDEFLANVTGALQVLLSPDAWTQYGTLTAQQSADALVDMFDGFCFGEGTCRMVGEIILFASATSPDLKWLPCDGSSLLRASYPDLFAVIGTTYGAIDGAHFSLPDMRGRSPMAQGTGVGLSPRTVGDILGEETHVLVTAELAAHSHADLGHTHAVGTDIPTGTAVPPPFDAGLTLAIPPSATAIGFANIQNTGSNTAHNTIHPVMVISAFIVAVA